MKHKTAVERLKENEENINTKARIRGFMVEITDNKNNTGSITVWNFDKNAKKFNEILTIVEIVNIEGVADYQVTIKKNNEILEDGLFLDYITQWIYNRLHNEDIEYVYQFVGGEYNGKSMNRTEIESISHSTTEDLTHIRQQGGTCHRKELDNQPLVNGYLSPMFSHIDYGLIYLKYETQDIYNMMSN